MILNLPEYENRYVAKVKTITLCPQWIQTKLYLCSSCFFSVVVSVFFKTILIIFLFFIFQKPTKYKAPYSSDCKLHYELRGKVVLGLGPIEAITQQKGKIADLFYRHVTTKLNIVGSRNISPKEEKSQVRRTHLIQLTVNTCSSDIKACKVCLPSMPF